MKSESKPCCFRGPAYGYVLMAAACLPCWGCQGGQSPAKGWLDPLGLTSGKQDLSDQPEFRQRVAKDPFPAASQVGLATSPKAEPQ
jgi:hypothetical protein